MLRNPKKEWGRKKREKKKEVNEYRFLQSRELALLTKALGYTHTHPSIHAQVMQQTTPIFKIIGLLPWKHINTVSLFTNQILKLFSDLAGNTGDVRHTMSALKGTTART